MVLQGSEKLDTIKETERVVGTYSPEKENSETTINVPKVKQQRVGTEVEE